VAFYLKTRNSVLSTVTGLWGALELPSWTVFGNVVQDSQHLHSWYFRILFAGLLLLVPYIITYVVIVACNFALVKLFAREELANAQFKIIDSLKDSMYTGRPITRASGVVERLAWHSLRRYWKIE
jgi:uncharacterized membrane protein HdeD (DUF308 family)